jgi:hypothetical protein
VTLVPRGGLRRRLPLVVGTALVAVLATDLAVVAARRDPPAYRDVPAPTASPAVGLPAEDLEGRLRAPDGYERVDDAESQLGDLDARAFAARFTEEPAEAERVRTGLLARGFQQARGHLWRDGAVVYGCVVVRVATPAGAQQLLASSRRSEGAFTSATVPRAVTYAEEVGGFSVQHGLFARGRFVYEVTLTTAEPETDHARFDALLQEQRDHAERSDPVP